MKPARVAVRVRGDSLRALVNGRDAALNYRISELLPLTGQAMRPELTELLEFFLALYATDRLIQRSKRRWPRTITIEFPVASVERWNDCRDLLEELIWRSTGDVVTIVPTLRKVSEIHADSRAAHFVLQYEQPTTVVMLSEGLDSLCGAFHAARTTKERIAFVSIVTNSRKQARFDDIIRGLKRELGSPLRSLHFHDAQWHLEDAPRRQERTQRARTLLAIATGLTAACAYESPFVQISENGMGILNIPNPNLQSRHESSQVLHPSNLELWKKVSKLMLGGAVIVYPNRFRTKAEMCMEIPASARYLIRETSSCDAPQRVDAPADCGVCGSCLYRKMSLGVNGFLRHDTSYSSEPPAIRGIDPADVLALQAQEFARCLSSSEHFLHQWNALIDAFPTLESSITGKTADERTHEILDTVSLIKTHVSEVQTPIALAHAV
jgi:7-cyano-7-deazaguanine synthase in queuosine biosynthesis